MGPNLGMDSAGHRLTRLIKDHAQIMTTKLVALGLGKSSVFVSRNGEQKRLGTLAYVIHDQSYWGSCWWTNQKRDDVTDNQSCNL